MTTWKDERKRTVQRKQAKPQMPEGYYSGDEPNPNLRAFVEAHLLERPYDPETDKYDVPAFDHAIETTKATVIYNMHTYWSKKPHDAIRQYIRHYTKPGDLVLDPFCGSGGTALAALIEGRKAIAIDRSPAATFITKNYCAPVDVDELQTAFKDLKAKVKPEIDWLYETRCDRCGGKATTAYTVYSQVFQCPRCMEKVPLFDCPEVDGRTKAGKPKKLRVCPHCQKRGIAEEISTSSERFGPEPVLVSYICENGCKPVRNERGHEDPDPRKREFFERYDLGKIREVEAREIPHWYPPHKMMNVEDDSKPWGAKWRAGTSNFRTVAEMFTKRNLWALGALFENSRHDHNLRMLVNSSIMASSRRAQHLAEGGGYIPGTYYLPQISKERNVLGVLKAIFSKTISAKAEIASALKSYEIIISTESACNIENIPTASVDYIFTDPPYSDSIQFGELNFIWEAWLDFDTRWHDEEIIVNQVRGKTESDWARMMRQAMNQCFRVLKPGKWLSLCYHDTSDGTWSLIQDIMAEVGFMIDKNDKAIFIDTGGRTHNQYTADKVIKRDLVINFRKPKFGEAACETRITELDDFATFNTKIFNIIRDFLSTNPGSTKDHIFDEVVSRMVRRGQMEAHHFDDLLCQIAEPVYPEGAKEQVARWYLREIDIRDSGESAKEDAAANVIQEFIINTKKPEEEGVHYSDVFSHYIYAVPVKNKPRRRLAEWLLDYFYKTEEGTYRLPSSSEEEQIKKEGREKGVSRRIMRYLACLQAGVPVPASERPGDATIADWIRHCKRSGMFEQGKLLYEKGGLNLDGLTEEEQVNVDEDYQICTKMLTRSAKPEKKPRRTKNSQIGLEGFEA